ncbi:MAG: hypothetical protein WD802_03185 [Gemmatimonadaceae bacterium]
MPHITFVHGISNKPPPEPLHALWLRALAHEDGIDCATEGITSSMVYWADVMYPSPEPEAKPEESGVDLLEAGREAIPFEVPGAEGWRQNLSDNERAFVDSLGERLGTDLPLEAAAAAANKEAVGAAPRMTAKEMEAVAVLERIPLPWFIKRPLMKLLLRDVHHYLFDTNHSPRPGTSYKVRTEIRNRFLHAANSAPRDAKPHIVISHSMGTVVGYDCLKRVPQCPAVDALITIGSPLGLDEIQDKMSPEWSRKEGFPAKVSGPWINVYDAKDPVAGFDPKFANDYQRGGQKVVEDIREDNWGQWRHSITKYLKGPVLRRRVREILG